MLHSKTAILIFGRSPQTEALDKTISGNLHTDIQIWQNLNSHANRIAAWSSLPVIRYTEGDQKGNSFGEKFTNAASTAFEKGYENIIIIGSDCPGLRREHIIYAKEKLANGTEIVAGPDKRGGVYLLGINRNAFNKGAFLNFSWQTSSLFSELKIYASMFANALLKDHLQDVNTKKDALDTSSLFYCNKAWNTLVIKLLQNFSPTYRDVYRFVRSYLSMSNLALRAPPAFLIVD